VLKTIVEREKQLGDLYIKDGYSSDSAILKANVETLYRVNNWEVGVMSNI
jgi:hypothetical protein